MSHKKKLPRLPPKPRAAVLEEIARAARTALRMVPYGIGSALDFQIFNRLQVRDAERLRDFLNHFADELEKTIEDLPKEAVRRMTALIDTDPLRYILRRVLQQVARDIREEKLRAYRAALINTLQSKPHVELDRKALLLDVLDSLTENHLLVLQHLHKRRVQRGI